MGSSEKVGVVYMAMAALSTALMALFIKLAGKSGLSTWEILFWRSNLAATSCMIQLAWTRANPLGNRCAALQSHL